MYNKKFDRPSAVIKLLTLATNADEHEKKLLVSVSQLVQFLPMETPNSNTCETTLITRYILHTLQPLFDDLDNDVRLDFTFTLPAEPNQILHLQGSPVCIIAVSPHQTDDIIHVGYGEMKRSSEGSNHHSMNTDLVRLCIFSKNTVDKHSLRSAMNIQVVGSMMTFYLMKLHGDGLYCMTELAHMQIPMSIAKVPAYLTNFTQLKNILHVFKTLCLSNTSTGLISWRRPSLLSSDLNYIVNKTRDRKRKNPSGQYSLKIKYC